VISLALLRVGTLALESLSSPRRFAFYYSFAGISNIDLSPCRALTRCSRRFPKKRKLGRVRGGRGTRLKRIVQLGTLFPRRFSRKAIRSKLIKSSGNSVISFTDIEFRFHIGDIVIDS
jgi:hypothetical protein